MTASIVLQHCRQSRRQTAFFAIIGLCGSLIVAPANALECPRPQPAAQMGALKETQATIDRRSQELRAQGSAAIPSLIFQLLQSHPHASAAEITNYLITAYCPVVNQKPEWSESRKKQDIARFAAQVRQQLN